MATTTSSDAYVADKKILYAAGSIFLIFGMFFMLGASVSIYHKNRILRLVSRGAYLAVIISTIVWIILVNALSNLDPKAALLAPLCVGLALAISIMLLSRFLVPKIDYCYCLIGVCLGLPFFMWICAWREDLLFGTHVDLRRGVTAGFSIFITLIAGIILACNSSKLQMITVIGISSFLGAYLFIAGIDMLKPTGLVTSIYIQLNSKVTNGTYKLSTGIYCMQAAIIVASILATIVNWFLFNRLKYFTEPSQLSFLSIGNDVEAPQKEDEDPIAVSHEDNPENPAPRPPPHDFEKYPMRV